MAKRLVVTGILIVAVLFALSGCSAEVKESQETKAVKETKVAPESKEVTSQKVVLRVNCGASEPYTDKAGNAWLADQDMEPGKKWGAVEGTTLERDELGITGTDAPKIYEAERYSMTEYKFLVPDGKYTVRLHFAETYDGISGEEQRVFSVTINGKTVLENFDVWKAGGGFQKPVVKEFKGVVPISGALTIGFVPNTENPQINGIEVISE